MTAPVNGNGYSKWQLWVSVATLALAAFGAIVTLYVQLADLSGRARSLEAQLQSVSVRTQEHERSIADLRTNDARFEANLTEVETQFHASDIVRNLYHANDLRSTAMLWKKAFGVEYPLTNAYYPEISANASARVNPPR